MLQQHFWRLPFHRARWNCEPPLFCFLAYRDEAEIADFRVILMSLQLPLSQGRYTKCPLPQTAHRHSYSNDCVCVFDRLMHLHLFNMWLEVVWTIRFQSIPNASCLHFQPFSYQILVWFSKRHIKWLSVNRVFLKSDQGVICSHFNCWFNTVFHLHVSQTTSNTPMSK